MNTATPSKAAASLSPPLVQAALQRAVDHILGLQQGDGFWECELIVDSTVVSDWVFYWHYRGKPERADLVRSQRHLLKRQLADGGWPQFPGGPSEINATIKAYHALRLCGLPASDERLQRARVKALELGGIPAMHTFGKLYLAIVGVFPWKYCPVIPVEMMLAPLWCFFHIYKMSAWSRSLVVPLAVINAFRPVRILPACPSLDELYPGGTKNGDWSLPREDRLLSWKNLFLTVNEMAVVFNHLPRALLRNRALALARRWMLERIKGAPVGQGASDGMGAIFPGMMNTLIALDCLGLDEKDPLFAKEEKDFADLCRGEEDDLRVAPCFSPVWDTALLLQALCEARNLAAIAVDEKAMRHACDWLVSREITIKGDWAQTNRGVDPGGFAFEFNNDYYPDVDDTFQVILGLKNAPSSDPAARDACVDRSIRWCRAFQCREGGFAAFDKDVTDEWLNFIPFADHNAILDPPCSDITGRGLETLACCRYSRGDAVVERAREFLLQTQMADGTWYGRWGVNYIYGTGHALRGLAACGEDLSQPRFQKSLQWLEAIQQEDGGWGESCWTYHDSKSKGQGPTTISQTAWAVLALLAFGDPWRPSVRRGIEYLLGRQRADGGWAEEPFTGTGFPRIFYLKYTSYPLCWPVMALSRWLHRVRKD